MPAKGRELARIRFSGISLCPRAKEHADEQAAQPERRDAPKVTTGPLSGSRKVYSSPEGHDDLSVPLREIALTRRAAFRVYDTSGPYTDPVIPMT